ncbi:hypothetical protein AB0L41_45120 [Amycolatopsis mediterranei]|uniref:hypothetical protein n=1 Tax=Amycolatopsis mediterranei TaxID=33910 RepID=UPI003445BB1B
MWIISLFLAVSETTVGVAATQATAWVQGLFALSATVFPLLVSGAFFAVRWKKPQVFYAPKDFPEHVTVPDFVEGLHRTAPADLEQVGGIVRNTLTSVLPAILAQQVPAQEVEAMVSEAVSTVGETLRNWSLVIDLRAVDAGASKVEWIIHDRMSVSGLLNSLWLEHLHKVVPAYTYPHSWVLMDPLTGKIFDQMGSQWVGPGPRDPDNRSLAQVGIYPGMELMVKLAQKAARRI